MQTTSHILMVRPVAFSYNTETAVNNTFQRAGVDAGINARAQNEFDYFVAVLRSNDIDVTVINDVPEPHTPDSIFPNNWASFHSDGTVVVYPMFATNRRTERTKGIIEKLGEQFYISHVIDLTHYEAVNKFLEGTGSMVLDREHRIAYACRSPRTHPEAFADFCMRFEYEPVLFTAKDEGGKEIYHTNVMMCMATEYVVICMDSVADEQEKEVLLQAFAQTRKEVIAISREQMNQFAGNMLQVHNRHGKKFLIMSAQAYRAFTLAQIQKLQTYNHILHAPLYTIEQNGGGSARCMIAEIFLQENKCITNSAL